MEVEMLPENAAAEAGKLKEPQHEKMLVGYYEEEEEEVEQPIPFCSIDMDYDKEYRWRHKRSSSPTRSILGYTVRYLVKTENISRERCVLRASVKLLLCKIKIKSIHTTQDHDVGRTPRDYGSAHQPMVEVEVLMLSNVAIVICLLL